MAQIHEVLDSNLHFIIDPLTRVLRIDTEDPDKSNMTVIQYDHNSERVTFEIPRMVDGHDMTLCNVVEVHYLNVSKDGRTQASGAYVVEDLGLKADDENTVVGTWLISGNATQIAGTLNFLVRFVCISGNTPDYVWNSAIYQSIAVSSGLYSGEEIVTEYPDVIAQWEARLIALETNGVPDDRIAEAVSDYLAENPPEVGNVVKTVNGVAPDVNGNVTIEIPEGGSVSDEQIATAVSEYMVKNPIQSGATEEQANQITQNKDDITNLKNDKLDKSGWGADKYLGTDADGNIVEKTAPESSESTNGLTSEQIAALDGLFKIAAYTEDASAAYSAFMTAFGITDEGGGDNSGSGDNEGEEDPEKTLASISAVYTGGSVAVGTSVNDLTGITVTAHYSDGTSEVVTGYTLTGAIAEGSNTITVSYGGKTTTFTVTGVAESGGNETTNILDGATWTFGTLGRLGDGTLKDYGGTSKEYTGFIPLNGATKVVANATGALRQIGYFFAEESADSVVGATVLETTSQFYISANNASYPSPVETEIPSGANYIIIVRASKVTDVTIELI